MCGGGGAKGAGRVESCQVCCPFGLINMDSSVPVCVALGRCKVLGINRCGVAGSDTLSNGRCVGGKAEMQPGV